MTVSIAIRLYDKAGYKQHPVAEPGIDAEDSLGRKRFCRGIVIGIGYYKGVGSGGRHNGL